uniref:Cadherin domain-containing protein n=2 Tax=Mesocestoides corti TaxID=53468 RepID=A0A5K3FCI1_MESCO
MQSITSLQLRLRLFLLLLLLFFVLLPMVSSFISANEIAQIHLFLREEEIPAGKVVLSASRAFKLAREYAKRGVSSVIIEGPMESPHELHQQDAPFNTSFEYPIFNMNRLTGLLKTAKRLDFDDAELHDAGCILSETVLPIQLTNQRSPSYVANTPYCCFPIQIFNSCQDILNVDICVEDINDNAPKWDLESPQKNDLELILRIPENMPVGNSLELPSAVDLDSGPNKLLTYEMRPKLPEFEVVWNDTSSRLHLYLKVELDREEKSYYSFTITAFDGGIKPRSGSLDVIIQILDVNDNSPVFEKNIYFVSIPENTKALMPIVQVVAVDIDHGENAEVAYTISPLTDPEFAQLFVVDLSTGWITLKGKLDFEDYKEISLTIVASDKGDPPRRSTCQVQMVVTDINDNAPQLLFEPISLTGFALVPENENPGRVVSVFTVIDEDSGVNGETVCWVASIFRNEDDLLRDKLGPDSLFKLDLIILPFTKVYQLSTAAVFDRESGNEYRVGITCSDKGYPSQNSTDHVIVRILDVNDHAPVFPFKHFTYRAIESYPLNTTLFTLTAIDLDEGENATITYSLLSPQDNIFTINNETGEVSLSQPLDYEKQTQHNFTIVAVDGGSPALTGSITVTLFVDDVNDNAPILTSDRFISILENHSAADPIGALRATDYDLGPNGNIYFKLTSIRPCFCGIPGTEEKTPDITESLCSWAVELVNKCDVQTVKKAYRLCSRIPMNHAPSWASKEYRRFLMTEKGDVFLRYPNLDRETTPVYMIQGVVADRGHPPKRTTFCITIAVDDINDCHPKFTFPASFNNTVLVRM